MKRRTLFGLSLAGLCSLGPLRLAVGRLVPLFPIRGYAARQEPLAPPAMPIVDPSSRPAPFGPTMEQLIDLAEASEARSIYDRLLGLALRRTGPVVADRGGPMAAIYHCGGFPPARFGHIMTLIDRASCVPVPESLLPHFRPENRGEEFPRGIPYVPLK
jgi:hypothetical protein